MQIVCPNCTASYDVKPEILGKTGRKVRCINCRNQWLATPPKPPALTVMAPPTAPILPEPERAPAMHAVSAPPAMSAPPLLPAAPVRAVEAEPPAAEEPVGAPVAHPPDPPQTPREERATPIVEAASGVVENIEAAAAARAAPPTNRRKPAKRTVAFLPILIGIQLVMIGAILLWRDNIVRVMPPTAALFRAIGLTVNLRGLAFSDLRSSQDVQDGVAVLFIDGVIRNITGTVIPVPRLRFSLRDASGNELLSWTAPPDQGRLEPGERLPFRSRLASPPAEGRDVAVRFVNRGDFTNGAR